MDRPRKTLALAATCAALAASAVLDGCSGDPLHGRWRNQRTLQNMSVTTTFEFKGGGFVDITEVSVVDTSATMLAGCTTTTTVVMQGYETTGSTGGSRTIAFNGAGICNTTRTGCSNRADNYDNRSCAQGMIGLGTAMGTFTIMNDALTIMLSDGRTLVCSRN